LSVREWMKLRDELEEQVPGDGVSINLGFPSRPRTRRRRRNISRVSRGMSSGVRSEGMPRSLSELMKMMDELEEQVPGDGVRWGVDITKHPHKPEKESKKEKRSKKRKSLDRPKSAEAKGEEMARHAAMCGVGITKNTVVDAGPKEDGVALPSVEGKRRKKVVTWRLSQELLEFLRTKEVMGYMATEIPRSTLVRIPEELFDRKLKEERNRR